MKKLKNVCTYQLQTFQFKSLYYVKKNWKTFLKCFLTKMSFMLTLNGTRRRSSLLLNTIGCGLIVPSNVQYCSSTQSRAAAHPM